MVNYSDESDDPANGNEENFSSLEKISLDSVVDAPFNSLLQGVELEAEISDDFKFPSVSTDGFVRVYRTKISGFLAISLWFSLIGIIIWHLYMVMIVAKETLEDEIGQQEVPLSRVTEDSTLKNNDNFMAHDKVASLIGDTAKTLYAVITPLATSITGFYFVLKDNDNNEDGNT